MGRTKRRRIRRARSDIKNLDHEPASINLRQWLVRNKWDNHSNLQLRYFPNTSRGMCSSKNIYEDDILIRIPYELLITYKTLELNGLLRLFSLEDANKKFKMIDFLALFLVLEKQKGDTSKYRNYIEALPYPEPILPWFCTPDELNLYPPDLRIPCEKALFDYQESFLRVKGSISSSVRVTDDLYKWAYVLVNTRAVYVDPQVSCRTSRLDFISDEPSMALCPFLDMFNHHYLVNTDAEIASVEGRLFYQLRTHTKTRKFEQIFICYGPHDNAKLLREYGFFVPGNVYDCVRFDFNEVRGILEFKLDSRRFKFVKDHGFDTREKLYVDSNGMSFGLKALLFVGCNSEVRDFNSVIFGNNYPAEVCQKFKVFAEKILCYKCKTLTRDYEKLKDYGLELSESAKLMLSYLEYRVKFVEELRKYFG